MDCPICDSRLVLEWTDLHGQAICIRCGTPFMCAGYNGRAETACAIVDAAFPLLRAYWAESGRPNGQGTWLGVSAEVNDQRRAFNEYVAQHPELVPA